MTSQGQRFRRRAIRRGYKVDEVDAFLDRVEATLAGEPIDNPVSAQEVHDVVFRVRFGGYDEWQVDLHLDRVERQLSDAATGPATGPGGAGMPAPAGYGPGPDPRMGGRPLDRMAGPYPDRGAPPPMPDRMGPPMPDRLGPPDRMGPPLPDRMGPPDRMMGPPDRMGPERVGPERMVPPHPSGPPRPVPSPGPAYHHEQIEPPAPAPPYSPYDEPTYGGGFDREPARPGPVAGRMSDMSDATSEMRLGDLPSRDPGRMMSQPPPMVSPPPPPMSGIGPAPISGAGPMNGPAVPASPEVRRVDELRRRFQPRRFGSGYDRGQVDQLFEQVIAAVSGQGPQSVRDDELDPRRFDLVPGGYFEGDVDAALLEVRDILSRRAW